MNRLEEIRNYLEECGVEAEIRNDRKDPYVNVGYVKRKVNRMQFWIPDHTDEVHMFVGKEMGKWFAESSKSVYLKYGYRHSDQENKVEFPNMTLAKQFIKDVASL